VKSNLKLLRKRFAIAGESHERMPRFKRGSPRHLTPAKLDALVALSLRAAPAF